MLSVCSLISLETKQSDNVDNAADDGDCYGPRSMGGQEDISPYILKWRGHPVFCPPTFSGVHIFY